MKGTNTLIVPRRSKNLTEIVFFRMTTGSTEDVHALGPPISSTIITANDQLFTIIFTGDTIENSPGVVLLDYLDRV